MQFIPVYISMVRHQNRMHSKAYLVNSLTSRHYFMETPVSCLNNRFNSCEEQLLFFTCQPVKGQHTIKLYETQGGLTTFVIQKFF